MKRLILFLIRRRLGLRKWELFTFTNQKSNDLYFFTEEGLFKRYHAGDHWGWHTVRSSVSLNWLLDEECQINKIEGGKANSSWTAM